MADACVHFDVPVVGGNVSLYNENNEGAIDPTPVVSMIGLIEKPNMVTRSRMPEPGMEIILLGGLPHELGASYHLQVEYGLKDGKVPEIDLDAEVRLQSFLLSEISAGRISAAHDLAEGGLLVALVEMLFGEPLLGADLNFSDLGSTMRLDCLFFGESQGRVLVAVSTTDLESLLIQAREKEVPAQRIGNSTNSSNLKVRVESKEIFNADVSELQRSWEDAIPSRMKDN